MKTPPVVSGGLPVLGHALEMMNSREKLFKRGNQEFGDIFAIQLGNQYAAVLGNKAYNRTFYQETDKSLNISDVYEFLHAAIGEVLFTASKEEYYNQRPVLQAIFKRERMIQYITAMNKEVALWFSNMGDEGKFDVSHEMLRLSQYVAAHAFLGENFREDLDERFWDAYADIGKSLDVVLPPNLPLPKFKRRDKAKAYIREVFWNLVAKRRENLDAYDDLIKILLTTPQKDGSFMDEEGIATLFVGLLFAGHETTAGQAAWTIIQLLQHPSYLKLVQAEVDEQLMLGQEVDGMILHKLEHLYWAIDETSRLRPSADMQMRIVEEPIELGEYTIPAGWRLIASSTVSHYDEATFKDSERYNPLRFSPQNNQGSDPFSMVSFGGGIHKCTGMNFAKNEMATITALLLQNFELELVTKNPSIVTTAGANRPSETWIRYRRKSNESIQEAHAEAAVN